MGAGGGGGGAGVIREGRERASPAFYRRPVAVAWPAAMGPAVCAAAVLTDSSTGAATTCCRGGRRAAGGRWGCGLGRHGAGPLPAACLFCA
ncbi:unnamed protein product [Urochloa humidicola]